MKRIILILLALSLALAAGTVLAEDPAGASVEEYAEVPAGEIPAVPAAIPTDVSREESSNSQTEENAQVPAGVVSAEEDVQTQAVPADVSEESLNPQAEEYAEVPAVSAEEPVNDPVQAFAEEPAAEVISGEVSCPHTHTKTVNYFDAPDYRPIDDANHLVVGSAVVEVDCLDCGAILSVSSESNVEEVNPHLFRNGYCVFCGREAPTTPQPEVLAAAAIQPAPTPYEVEVYISAGENPNQFFASFTDRDLEAAGDTLVLRPEGMDAALAMQTGRLREEMEQSGGALAAEISKPGERDVSTSLRLYDASGMEFEPAGQGISLRIYAESRPSPLTVSYTNAAGATSTEEARWADGYWVVTWLGDGLYQYQ